MRLPRSKEEQATREGDLACASELRYGTIPALQQKLAQAEEVLEKSPAGRRDPQWKRLAKTSRGGWIHVDGIPVTKMMQGEMAGLVDLKTSRERVVG